MKEFGSKTNDCGALDKMAIEKQNFLRQFSRIYGIDLFNIDCFADTEINVSGRRFDFMEGAMCEDFAMSELSSDEERWLAEFSELFSALNSLIKEIGVVDYAEAMEGSRLDDKLISVSNGLFVKIQEVMDKFKNLKFSDVNSNLDRFMASFRDVISRMDIKPDNGFFANGDSDKVFAISGGRFGRIKNSESGNCFSDDTGGVRYGHKPLGRGSSSFTQKF